jgi:anti-sigma factor RsiW
MPHPDEGLIHAWLDGELEPNEASRVAALVATDPGWSAAVAEARGLIAASSRVVSALDRMPANVVPAAERTPRRASWWLSRVAVLLLVVVGASVVLRRDPTVQTVTQSNPGPKAVTMTVPPVVSSPMVPDKKLTVTAAVTSTALAAAENRGTAMVDAPFPDAITLKKTVEDSVSTRREQLQERALQFTGTTAAPSAARTAVGASREDAAKSAVAERCFASRALKSDSTAIIRFVPNALADSVRAGWALIADSLLSPPKGRPPLHRVPCPMP